MATRQRIKALQAAQHLATVDKNQAATHMQAQQQRAEAAEQQLQQLRSFQEDYAVAASKLGNARQLQQYYAFLARLEQSVTQQQNLVTINQRAVEESRDRWAGLYHRSQALDNAVDKAQADHLRVQYRRIDDAG